MGSAPVGVVGRAAEPVALTTLQALLAQAVKAKSPEPNAILRRYCAMFVAADRVHQHGQRLGIRRGSEDLHASGGQINDEHGVVSDQASPRPDFRREEIRAGNRVPVRLEKRLPRGRPRRHRWSCRTSAPTLR